MNYPELKRSVASQAARFFSDKYSDRGQSLRHATGTGTNPRGHLWSKTLPPTVDKIMRPHSVTSTIENGFVYVPEEAEWLEEYLHDLTTFPNGKYDDQADSTSQALEWVNNVRSFRIL